jgi:methanogenic corrinoid protein MtbC1
MTVMKDIVDKAVESGIRDTVKIMVGGAPVTENFCKSIGADSYTPDAASAANKAITYMQ